MKTTGVKALVREVLDSMSPPFSEHVIDEVMHRIETGPGWRRRYDLLCDELGQATVNAWCGQWIANALGKRGKIQVPSRKSTLIQSYSLLDRDAAPVQRKPGEQEARQLMADHYRANKDHLPPEIRQHREAIVELIMDGMPADEAFAFVLQQLAPV